MKLRDRRRGSRIKGLEVLTLVLVAAGALGAGPADRTFSDLRIRSEMGETVVEAFIGEGVVVEDLTRRSGATTVSRQVPGLVSTGETFTEEIRIGLPGIQPRRATSVIVGDPLVSEVRVLFLDTGSLLAVFVRQPVRYEVSRVADGKVLRVHVRPGRLVVEGRAPQAVIAGQDDEREVTLDAETVRYDRQENVIEASGGVTIRRPGTILMADEVRVNRSTYDGDATGNVVLRTEGSTVHGDYVHLNLTDETGWIDAGEIDFSSSGSEYKILGQHIEKGFGQAYDVRDGVVTTCRCGGLEPPSWSIAARRLDVDLAGRGTARHVTLRVRDVPVFYLPYGVFPVNKTRQSGFLMPRAGLGNKRGFKYEQPFYWAIDRSSDASFAFDIETNLRVGGVGEYRYARDGKSRGTIAGTYFNEVFRSEEDLRKIIKENAAQGIVEIPTESRWGAFTDIRQGLPADVRAYADTMLVSDDLFFTDIESASFEPIEEEAARTRFYTASRVGVLKTWERMGLWGESAFFQDLDVKVENEDDAVLQRVPGIEFRTQRAVMNDRLVLSFGGEAVDYQRRVGFDGLRLDLLPKAEIPFNLGRAVFGSLEASLRETLYHLTDRDLIGQCRGGSRNGNSCMADSECPDGGSCAVNFRCRGGRDDGSVCTADSQCEGGGTCKVTPTGELRDQNSARGLVQLGWQLGTEVARVYPFGRWGFRELKHTIEPTVSYLFVPMVDGQDELPLFDGVDRVNRRNLFSYGFVSRLKTRLDTGGADAEAGDGSVTAAPTVREVASLSLLQVYDTERKIGGDDHFSDIDIGLQLTPGKVLALEYGATYNARENRLKGTSVNFSLRESWQADNPQLASLQSPSHLSFSYRFVDENVGAEASAGQKDLAGFLYLRVGRFLGLVLQGRFNLLAKEQGLRGGVVREAGVGARFISRCNCWMLEVGAEDRADTDETLVRAQLTLSGIGSLGSAPGQTLLTSPGFRRGR